MFYSAIEDAGDKDIGSSIIVVETIWWFFLWCILEAYALEGIFDFIKSSAIKTASLFESLGMDLVAIPFDWITEGIMYLDYLMTPGNGDIFDWLEQALIVWACTGLPMLFWRGYKMELRSQRRN